MGHHGTVTSMMRTLLSARSTGVGTHACDLDRLAQFHPAAAASERELSVIIIVFTPLIFHRSQIACSRLYDPYAADAHNSCMLYV